MAPIFDLFSKRQRRQRGEVPDVYIYDKLPGALRVQVIHIIRDALGTDLHGGSTVQETYQFIHDTLCREYGLFELTPHANVIAGSVFNFFFKH